jgi:hypothetical protein
MGQLSERFRNYPLPSLSHLSFTIIYRPLGTNTDKTLDLTAKDEYEFDLWVTGIRGLTYHRRGYTISKMTLLAHSKSFNEQIQSKKVANANKAFFAPEENANYKNSKTLEDCILRKGITKQQVAEKLISLTDKVRDTRWIVEELEEDIDNTESSEVNVGAGYSMINQNEKIADDNMQ